MRRSTGAARLALATLIVMAGGACASAVGGNGVLEPRADDTGATVSVRRARTKPVRSSIAPTFWESVSALDPDGAGRAAHTVGEHLFARALGLLIDGRTADAEVMFRGLMTDDDRIVRGRARIGVTLALEADGRWSELAAVPRIDESASDSTVRVDRAAVDAWAGVLRGLPPVQVSIPAAPVTVPVERSELGTPIISVHVNGHRHRFWLDTGASMSLLSSDVAAEAGITPLGSDTLAIAAAAGRVAARPAMAAELAIGGVSVRDLPVAILDARALRLDHVTVNGASAAVAIDGVVGADVLRRLDVRLDMNEGTLTLARPGRHPARTRTLLWAGFPVVRLLTRDGRPVLFGLDTGADSTVVTDSWLDRTPDPTLAPGRAAIDALGRQRAASLPVVRRVIVSDGEYALRLRDVPVVPDRRVTFVAVDGILGASILSGAAIRMDMTNGIFEIRVPRPAPLASDTGFVRIRH